MRKRRRRKRRVGEKGEGERRGREIRKKGTHTHTHLILHHIHQLIQQHSNPLVTKETAKSPEVGGATELLVQAENAPIGIPQCFGAVEKCHGTLTLGCSLSFRLFVGKFGANKPDNINSRGTRNTCIKTTRKGSYYGTKSFTQKLEAMLQRA